MKIPSSLLRCRTAALLAAAVTASVVSAPAATINWTGGTSDWDTAANWNSGAGPVPGTADLAYFSGTATPAITFSAPSTVNGITFDTSGVGAYTIGVVADPSALTLSTGGAIQMTSSVANSETINQPLILSGNYSFLNNAPALTSLLNIGGTVSTTTGGVLTLGGTNTGSITGSGASLTASTISGAISGAGSILKTGAGSWTLSGTNSYSGTTTVNGGTLRIGSSTSLPGASGGLVLDGGKVSYVGTATTWSYSQALKIGINGATIENANGIIASPGPYAITFAPSSVGFVTGQGAGDRTLTLAAVSGSGSNGVSSGNHFNAVIPDDVADSSVTNLVVAGPWYLDAANTFTGTTTVNSGAVLTLAAGSLTNGRVTLIGTATLGLAGSVTKTISTLDSTSATASVINGIGGTSTLIVGSGTYAGKMTDSGTIGRYLALSVNGGTGGTGTFATSGLSTFAGNVAVTGGTLKVTASAVSGTVGSGLGFGDAMTGNVATATPVGTTTVSGGSLDLSGTAAMTIDEPIILSGGTLTNSGAFSTTVDNGVAGIAYRNTNTTASPGTVTITPVPGTGGAGAAATATLTGTNNNLKVTAAGTGYTVAPTVTFGGTGTNLGATAVLSSVSLTGTSNVINGTGGIVINAVVADGTGAGGFTKSGTNTLTLTGANTYTGGTTVTAGRLLVNNTLGTGTGTAATTLTGTSALSTATLGGNGTLASVSAGTFSVLNPGVTPTSISNLTISGSLAMTSTSGSLLFNLGASNTSSELLIGTGSFVGNTVNFFNTTGGALSLGLYTLIDGSSALTGLTTGGISGTGNSIITGGLLLGTGFPGVGQLELSPAGDNVYLNITAVPEPTTWAMIIIGSLFFAPLLCRSTRRA